MIAWFANDAPIRRKFDTLRWLHLAIVALSGGALLWIDLGGGNWPAIMFPAASVVLTLMLVTYAKRLICDPYVATVERLEALAAGDLESPVQFTSHGDCVGRLARAMAVFSANARKVRESSEERKLIVEELGTAIDALAKGNLARRIERAFPGELDTLRTCFNAAVTALSDVMNAVSASANSIDTGAGEIRAASDDLAVRTEQQAARLEAASAAMQQVTELVRGNLGSVAEVERSVAHAQHEAEHGGTVVEDAVEAMHRIQKSSQEVGQISSVIDGIAFQTNLLARNAGVEAARAGDAGKGFAVVANEVRALAQRSADAAREINQLITTASQEVDHGVKLVGDTGRVLGDIVSRVSSVNTLTATIAAAANRQAAMLEEVNDTVRELDRMTQQNAAMVEESTAAARNLAGEAMELSGQVARFGTGIAKRPQNVPAIVSQRLKQPVARSQGNFALAISEDEDWSDF